MQFTPHYEYSRTPLNRNMFTRPLDTNNSETCYRILVIEKNLSCALCIGAHRLEL
jgi:hypothetical protein